MVGKQYLIIFALLLAACSSNSAKNDADTVKPDGDVSTVDDAFFFDDEVVVDDAVVATDEDVMLVEADESLTDPDATDDVDIVPDIDIVPTTFSMIFGGSEDDLPSAIIQTTDGGYAMAGYLLSFGPGDLDILVLKLKENGDVEWQQTYGGNEHEEASSIIQTNDGGYAIAGQTQIINTGSRDALVLKLDGNGNVVWKKTYGGTLQDQANGIVQTAEGEYVVAGATCLPESGDCGGWILKLDNNGEVIWQRAYAPSGSGEFASIIRTSNGGYAVAGWVSSYSSPIYQKSWVLKLDGDGNIVWQKTMSGDYTNQVWSIVQTSDGGYVAVGYTNLSTGSSINGALLLLKLNAKGDIDWQQIYDTDAVGGSILQTPDGKYVVAGSRSSWGAGLSDVWLLGLNGNGEVLWQKTYGGSGGDGAGSIIQTLDGGYALGGVTQSFGFGKHDLWVLKVNSDGAMSPSAGCPETMGQDSVSGAWSSSYPWEDTIVTPVSTSVVAKDASFSETERFVSVFQQCAER